MIHTMNDGLFDLVIIIGLGVIPLFAGALKGYSANGIIRILSRFAAPTISAVAITYVILYHSLLLSPFGITFDDNNTNQEEYVVIPIAISFVVLLELLFYKMVSFGESIGQEEDTGLRADGTKITDQVNHIITPTLDDFTEKMQDKTEEKLESFTAKLTNTIIPQMKKITENQQNIINDISRFNINEEQRGIHQNVQDEKIVQLIDDQQKQNDILKAVQEWIAQNPNTYEILISRIEAINTQNKTMTNETSDSDYNDNGIRNTNNNNDDNDSNRSTGDSNTKTLLTTQDGIANRAIGHKKQEEMAQYLRDVSFEVSDGHGAGEPDFIIKKKKITSYDLDGAGEENIMEIVAVGSNKSYTLKDQPKKKQRRISSDDCMPEIILAKKLHIPMIILVTNRNNGRRWAAKISYNELVNGDGKGKKWSGISTPVILAQDDPESAQMLEEKFCSILASIGARV